MKDFFQKKQPWWVYGLPIIIFIATAALLELMMGRVLICECGDIKFWHGVVFSSENSQHISDWYSISHVIHGFLFYLLLWLLAKKFPRYFSWLTPGWRLVIAVLIEAAWEVFENSSIIINRYREVTISLDYFGDSVLNSMSDILYMMFGFYLAHREQVWVSVALVIALELFVGYWIRDNLTLNIIMLIHPVDFVLKWQNGG
ncbi:MAG: DUF2585 family protein [bacterium]|nr:DUF2585 family protein [bacterium]